MEPAFFPKPVWGHNDQSDNRGESGCKYCSKHPHSTRKNENIVKHHIKEAPRDRGDHGKLRIAVISHKAENDIVEDKGWGKQHQHLQISGRHLPDFLIRTENGGNPSGKENPARHKQKGEKDTKIHGICKNLIRPFFVVLAFQNRKFCSASHSEHESGSMNEIIDGNCKIQGRKPICPDSLRYEKRICKNITGNSNHPHNTEKRVSDKFHERCCLYHKNLLNFELPSKKTKKALSFCISKGLSIQNPTLHYPAASPYFSTYDSKRN